MEKPENQTLGQYNVVREIARGNMGRVYLGHDPVAGRDVAIKVANPASLQDKQDGMLYRKLFFNEAKVARMLKHPNILSVYDAGVEGDTCYMVMEYVPGGRTLKTHCRPSHLLPIDDVVWVIFKCAKALDYAHRKGVIHRDIKPGNVLLTQDGEVKIGDFGVALTTRDDISDTHVLGYVGSPLYMSPEQVRQETVSYRTDIFSLGVVMYELLTGKHPFIADNLPAIMDRIMRKEPTALRELRTDVPEILGFIVDRTLKKNPNARYKAGLDLAGDLSLVFEHLTSADDNPSDKEKFELVRDLEFFNDFAEPEIWEVLYASIWLEFEPHAEIIQEGEEDNSFFIIVAGDVLVRKGTIEVDILRKGDCFGEMGFIDGCKRTASISAMTRVSVIKVRASLIQRASMNCQLRFHKVFLTTLIKRLSRATELITSAPKR